MIYKHVRPFRYFMGFSILFFFFFAIGSWFLDSSGDASFWIAFGLSLLFTLGALYSTFAYILSFGWARLDENAVTIKLFRTVQTAVYTDILDVKTGPLFITVITLNGRYRIDRNIHNYLTLIRDLKRRVPNIQHQKETWITNPLPRQISGKKSSLALFIFLFFLFIGSGILFLVGMFDKDHWGVSLLGIFIGLVLAALSLLIAHELLWVFPRYIRFQADQIIVQHFVGQQIYHPQEIESTQISTILAGKQKQLTYHLILKFKTNTDLKLEIRDVWFKEHIFQIMDLIVHHYSVEPIYQKRAENIRHTQFANGSKNPFPFYFQRESSVLVNSLDEISHWLHGCTYIRDQMQFGQNDVWVHPVDFENMRKGDCEDHALWAWRKLVNLKYPAEFVVGYVQNHFGDDGYHAWVTFHENGRSYLMETTAKNSAMIYPLETQTKKYRPLFSIDQNFKTYQF